MVIIEKKKGKTFAFFSLIIFIFVLVGMMGFVSANCEKNCVAASANTVSGTPLAGDFDGDDKSDLIIYNAGTWTAYLSDDGYKSKGMIMGGAAYTPYTADFNGDDKTDMLVYNKATGDIKFALSPSWAITPASIGPGWTLVLADYDGDQKADIMGYDETSGNWAYILSKESFTPVHTFGPWGGPGWKPVQVDYEKQRNGDIFLYNSQSGQFKALIRSNNYAESSGTLQSGSGWKPILADYDGDTKTDLLVYQDVLVYPDVPMGIQAYYAMSRENYKIEYGGLNVDGTSGWTVVSGNWDSTPRSDLLVYKNGVWWASVCDYVISSCPTCGVDDGCGVKCTTGACTSPNVCGGGGTSGVCGCDIKTCADYPGKCGSLSNGCGGTIECGLTNCGSGQVCKTSDKTCCTVSTYDPALNTFCGSKSVLTNCGINVTKNGTLVCQHTDPFIDGQYICDTREGTNKGNCVQAYLWYRDCDGDKFGNPLVYEPQPITGMTDCSHTRVRAPNNTDCDDSNSNINPNKIDTCNNIDDNCNNNSGAWDNNSTTGIDEEGCITSVGWTNLLGVGIIGTYINNTVLMGIGGTNLNVNNLNYKISGPQSFSSTFTRIAQLPFSDSYFWAASKSGDPFNFNASIIKGSVFISSKLSTGLRVNNTPNNALPVAIITAPITELNVKNATNINFNQASYDEDDLLKITWDFGDGTKKIITNYVNNPALIGNPSYNTSANVTHTYSSSGKYAVRLTAEEMTRGQSSESVIFINVFNLGINVIPIISSPENETKIEKKAIFFNASKSFVVDCSSTDLGHDIDISGLSIYCKYVHRPGAIPPISGYKIEMNWIINGDVSPILKSGNYSDVASFWQEFASNGDHNVSLIMKYIDGSVSSQGKANKNFNVETLWNCYQEGSSAYWWDNQHNKVTTNCSFKQSELGYSCCPVNKQCFPDGSCRNYASYCFQLNKTSCDLFVDSVPEKSINQALCSIKQRYNEGNLYCSNMTNCFCKWNSSSNICEEGVNSVKLCWTGNGTIEDDMTRGQCLWSTTEITDNCNNSLNNMITKKKASWVNSIISKPDWCEDIEKSYQCVVTEKLPFFDKIGVITAIILIISAYIYVLRRQKRIIRSIEKKINPKKTSRHEKKKSKR